MEKFQPKPFGKYFLVDKLATGGMAEIYKAKTYGVDGFEKQLVIKRILPHCSVDKEFIGMLVDEAKLSVLLSHTNIVQVYDLGKVGDDYFISMEFIDGVNLRQVINRLKEISESFSEQLAVYIISEVCKGLDYAHTKKDSDGKPLDIVHRDISPQNILLSYEGEVKIVDFGIAKAAMNIGHTMAGILKGKISYMSPEQAMGKIVDRRTDIFSVGLMFYELITGNKFFTGETQFEVLKKIRSTRINENSFPEKISEALRKILAKALTFHPKDRYQYASDLQADLTRYLYTTYPDFTPRKISNLVRALFKGELEERANRVKQDISIDPQTRSIIMQAQDQENLVHSDRTLVESEVSIKTDTKTFHPDAAKNDRTDASLTVARTDGMSSYSQTGFPAVSLKRRILTTTALSLIFLFMILMGLHFRQNIEEWIFPKPPAKGKLIVESTPEGAEVLLDDADTGLVTPANLDKLELMRPYKITLKKSRYKTWIKVLTIPTEEPISINTQLEVIPVGGIDVRTIPPGAKIFLNGEDTKLTSPAIINDLPIHDSYTLKLIKEKYKVTEEKITIYSIDPVVFNKSLQEILYGSIQVSSNPGGAHVLLNGKSTGQSTPATFSNLEADLPYSITLTKSGYKDLFRSVTVQGNQTASVGGNLIKEEVTKPTPGPILKATPKPTPGPIVKATPKPTPTPNKNNKGKTTNEINKVNKTGDTLLAVNSNPKGAAVFINGVQVGSTPGTFKVNPGTLNVTVTKDGATSRQVVTVQPGTTRSLGTMDLKTSEAGGWVRVDSNPTGAQVSLNGKPLKATPVKVNGLKNGRSYSISVSKNGYKTWSTSFTMGDEAKSFMANLQKD